MKEYYFKKSPVPIRPWIQPAEWFYNLKNISHMQKRWGNMGVQLDKIRIHSPWNVTLWKTTNGTELVFPGTLVSWYACPCVVCLPFPISQRVPELVEKVFSLSSHCSLLCLEKSHYLLKLWRVLNCITLHERPIAEAAVVYHVVSQWPWLAEGTNCTLKGLANLLYCKAQMTTNW